MVDKEQRENDLENAVSKGKKDWMNYAEKRKQIKEDRKKDADNNEKIAERKQEKNAKKDAEKDKEISKRKLDQGLSPTSGGFGLG